MSHRSCVFSLERLPVSRSPIWISRLSWCPSLGPPYRCFQPLRSRLEYGGIVPRGPSGCMHDVPEEWIDVTNVRRLNLLSVTQDECCVHMLHTYITAADGRDVVEAGSNVEYMTKVKVISNKMTPIWVLRHGRHHKHGYSTSRSSSSAAITVIFTISPCGRLKRPMESRLWRKSEFLSSLRDATCFLRASFSTFITPKVVRRRAKHSPPKCLPSVCLLRTSSSLSIRLA